MSEFVLCYVDAPWAYFTTQPLEDQWGDDWDDAPYEHNAGPPYDPPRPDLPAEERADLFPHAWLPDGTPRWRIERVAFDGDFITPGYGYLNSLWSVQRINRGEIAWLRPAPWSDHAVVIHAGTTLPDFIDAVQRAGGRVYVESAEIARLTAELDAARERERGYREALGQALDRGFPGDTHEGDCAVTRGMQCDCWIGQARALAARRGEGGGE